MVMHYGYNLEFVPCKQCITDYVTSLSGNLEFIVQK